ncbi:MAG: nicotinate-nucleotide adenylyltransferase [Planctomycetaceae bacterium]
MRLGLFGGTFDPVHFGHLLLAEQCREQCALDEVWFLPSGSPPHKQSTEITEPQHRIEMLKLAIAGHEAFAVNEMELQREGPTYTVDTLQAVIAERPRDALFFLIGGDSLNDLPTWREPRRILELATVVAVNRGDDDLPEMSPLEQQLGSAVARQIHIVSMPGVDISATDIRERVAAGKSIRYMTPRAVEVYVEQHGLYGGEQ